MNFTLLISLFFIFPSGAFALSTEFGNGGNIIICPPETNTPNQFYDTYEARIRYLMNPVFPTHSGCTNQSNGSYSQSCKEAVQKMSGEIIQRVKLIDGSLEADLQSLLKTFWLNTRIVDADLLPVYDAGLGFVPHGCSIKQVAIQHSPRYPEDDTYFIAATLFNSLTIEDQSALVLHEIIYRWALAQNSKIRYSENIRYFNALMLSNKISTMEPYSYNRAKKALISE